MRGDRRQHRSRRGIDGDDLELHGGEVGHDVSGGVHDSGSVQAGPFNSGSLAYGEESG
jgi:hypothetical protein